MTTAVLAITAVAVVVSLLGGQGGRPQRRVPNVTGESLFDGVQSILDHGYVVGTVTARAANTRQGTILEQLPSADTRSPRKAAVDLVISAGTNPGNFILVSSCELSASRACFGGPARIPVVQGKSNR